MIAQPLRGSPGRGFSVAAPRATTEAPSEETPVRDLEEPLEPLVARKPTPDDDAVEQQREAFDFVTRAEAEIERETNVLRDMAMEQMKQDDELLKKWIELI